MKISFKWLILIIVITGVLFPTLFIYLNIKFNNSNTKSLSLTSKVTIGFPVRIKIPSINVNTNIEYVGLTSSGAMDTPKDPKNTAWFNLGPRPGENGNAVIDGHSGYKDSKPAIFDNLHKIQIGDKVYIVDEKGINTIFIVHKIQTYNPQADAKDIFNSYDGKSHLNLITCGGTWDEIEQTHSNRLVIFTDREY